MENRLCGGRGGRKNPPESLTKLVLGVCLFETGFSCKTQADLKLGLFWPPSEGFQVGPTTPWSTLAVHSYIIDYTRIFSAWGLVPTSQGVLVHTPPLQQDFPGKTDSRWKGSASPPSDTCTRKSSGNAGVA